MVILMSWYCLYFYHGILVPHCTGQVDMTRQNYEIVLESPHINSKQKKLSKENSSTLTIITSNNENKHIIFFY